jgi:LmbE family N-acetylglucosaminyl deacetylase
MLEIGSALVIAAHPDDEVLGVGGTVPLIRRAGGGVTILIVTDGSSSQYPGDDAALVAKQSQARAAAATLEDSSLVQWDFPDMRLEQVPHLELNDAIGTLIRQGSFDTVFVHARSDVNRDHQEIHNAALVATRPVPDSPVNQVLAYEVNSSTEWGAFGTRDPFRPTVYVDITSTIDVKLRAMEAYAGELRPHPHPRSLEAIRDRARVRGSEVGFMFAEAFEPLFWRGAITSSGTRQSTSMGPPRER